MQSYEIALRHLRRAPIKLLQSSSVRALNAAAAAAAAAATDERASHAGDAPSAFGTRPDRTHRNKIALVRCKRFQFATKRNPIVQAISVQKYILQEAEEELCLATKHTLFVTLWQATSGIVLHILPPVQYYSNIIRIHY